MTADVTTSDLVMAIIIIVGILVVALAIIGSVGWFALREDNKIGPLARAQQDHEIEQHRVSSVLKAKHAEAEIALADAKIIEAQARVSEAQARANEADLARLDRQLTRGDAA